MRCVSCDVPMVPSGRPTVPPGHQRHHGRSLCRTCYERERHFGRLDQWPAERVACDGACPLCEDIQWMAETGAPAWEWAKRLGTTPPALSRRLRRHGQPDLARAVDMVVKAA